MRSGPVNLPAAGATPELFVIDFCKRLELFNHVGLDDFLERRIAAEATRERSDRVEEIKPTDHFDGLLVWILRTRAIAMLDNGVHQQTAIAREQSAIFTFHHAEQLSILCLAVVSDIEPEQAQIARKCPEMAICDKSLNGAHLQPLFLKQQALGLHRVKIDIRIFADQVREIDGLRIYKDQIDFGMRNAARLDYIFHGRLFAQIALDNAVAGLRFEEKLQIVVKFQPDPERAHITR